MQLDKEERKAVKFPSSNTLCCHCLPFISPPRPAPHPPPFNTQLSKKERKAAEAAAAAELKRLQVWTQVWGVWVLGARGDGEQAGEERQGRAGQQQAWTQRARCGGVGVWNEGCK